MVGVEANACVPPPAPQLSFQRKVGVLYCRAGQGSEEEMYNNEDAGAAFMQFLTLLGDVVRLKGFENYRAQLDTKSEAWGQGGGLPVSAFRSHIVPGRGRLGFGAEGCRC